MSSRESHNSTSSINSENEQRYLLAQYAADHRRMETRNIGVIVWGAGRAEARFLPEGDAADIVSDIATYNRWVSFWHRKIYSAAISVPGYDAVEKNDPAFLDAVLKTQKGNYLLFDAGFVTEPVTAKQLGGVASFLYDELVAVKKATSIVVEHDSLQAVAGRIFETSGVASRSDFTANYPVRCKVFGVEQELRFNYALAEEGTEAVFQRVPLRQQAIFGTATMFNCLVESRTVRNKKRCASLVDLPEDQREKPSVVKAVRMLRRVSEVIDLSEPGRAVEQIRQFASAA